ncbi:hypothetical protein ALC57_08034 [Trachymyrmex cornetzi]|uniref:Uncharacterized protein n=1 Tax=Trachymyrmex cornetzi TaxID=471704 RepID=A0A195E333_9HYME|nr:hypothetical protein ALC57_08034 [Trachymyrmex cornetzi]
MFLSGYHYSNYPALFAALMEAKSACEDPLAIDAYHSDELKYTYKDSHRSKRKYKTRRKKTRGNTI